MSTRVTIECTLDELHESIATSIAFALAAEGHVIVDRDGQLDTGDKVREMARNAAGGLMLYVVDEADAAAWVPPRDVIADAFEAARATIARLVAERDGRAA